MIRWRTMAISVRDFLSPFRLRELFKRSEIRLLVAVMAVSGAIWAFLDVADEVTEGDTGVIDRALLLALRNPKDLSDPIGPRAFEEAMRDVTALGGFTFLTFLTIVVTVALLFYGKRRHALVFASTVVLAEISADSLKLVYDRPRPDIVSHGSWVYSHSFPSGHSTMSAAVFLTLAAVLASLEPKRRAKVFTFGVAILLVVSIGLSRVYLGVHWPSDVLAGWWLGAAWALAARIAVTRWAAVSPSMAAEQGKAAKPGAATAPKR
jgi:undecaprenyl-diphosphatase